MFVMALGGDEVETIPLSAYRWVNQDLNLPIDPNQPQEATMIYVAPSEKQTMESMNLLASIVKTRQVDDSGSVSYFTLPERVPGTNDYKVDVAELMKEKILAAIRHIWAHWKAVATGLRLISIL